MTGTDFEHFSRLALARSGLVLKADKAYLVQSRLEPIARALGLPGVPELLERLRAGAPEPVVQRCVDAMATHESMFFRDTKPFEQIAAIAAPELVVARSPGRPIRIWSAACSSGQEPYSLAILMQELGGLLGGRRVEIIATDMSEAILSKAREGYYSDFEVRRGLSPERLKQWFRPSGTGWEVAPQLKAMVSFHKHNLLDAPAGLGVFDIVLCRNVLIYFEPAGKAKVLERVATAIAPDGVLFLGSAETVIGLTSAFVAPIGAQGFYRPCTDGVAPVARQTA